jgi:hypothetical protein
MNGDNADFYLRSVQGKPQFLKRDVTSLSHKLLDQRAMALKGMTLGATHAPRTATPRRSPTGKNTNNGADADPKPRGNYAACRTLLRRLHNPDTQII